MPRARYFCGETQAQRVDALSLQSFELQHASGVNHAANLRPSGVFVTVETAADSTTVGNVHDLGLDASALRFDARDRRGAPALRTFRIQPVPLSPLRGGGAPEQQQVPGAPLHQPARAGEPNAAQAAAQDIR